MNESTLLNTALAKANQAPIPAPVPSRNVLGSMADVENSGPRLDIDDSVLATRYRSHFDKEAIKRIDNGHDRIRELRQRSDEHSPVVLERKISALSEKYALNPTQANLDELRHARTLSFSDCDLIQQAVRGQVRAVMATITEDCKAICRIAAEQCTMESEGMDKGHRVIAEAFGVAFVRSPISAALLRRACQYRNESRCECAMDGIPTIANALCD